MACPPKRVSIWQLDDDLFHMDLNLAARCLIGTPRIRESWLRVCIITEMRQDTANRTLPLRV